MRLAARRQAAPQRRSMGYFENLPNEGKSYGYLFARKVSPTPLLRLTAAKREIG